MTIYIVSGWIRSGTSMMMSCLEAGGLEAVISDKREQQAQRRFSGAGYVANDKFYELTAEEMMKPGFPLEYEGKLIKCLQRNVVNIAAYEPGYKIVFMRRDPEEIRQSSQALFNRPIPPMMQQRIATQTNNIVGILKQRRDVDLIEVHYREAVNDPTTQFTKIKEAGWPIDVEKAAAQVDPAKVRYKLETLDPGA